MDGLTNRAVSNVLVEGKLELNRIRLVLTRKHNQWLVLSTNDGNYALLKAIVYSGRISCQVFRSPSDATLTSWESEEKVVIAFGKDGEVEVCGVKDMGLQARFCLTLPRLIRGDRWEVFIRKYPTLAATVRLDFPLLDLP